MKLWNIEHMICIYINNIAPLELTEHVMSPWNSRNWYECRTAVLGSSSIEQANGQAKGPSHPCQPCLKNVNTNSLRWLILWYTSTFVNKPLAGLSKTLKYEGEKKSHETSVKNLYPAFSFLQVCDCRVPTRETLISSEVCEPGYPSAPVRR